MIRMIRVAALVIILLTPLSLFSQNMRDYIHSWYREMSAQNLLDYWIKAPSSEKSFVSYALYEKRSEALPLLRNTLSKSANNELRLFACAMLAEMSDQDSFDILMTATEDQNDKIKVRAVSSLRRLANPNASEKLRYLIKQHPGNTPLIKTAIVALGELGSKDDIAMIVPFMAHNEENVRILSACSVAMLGNQVGEKILMDGTYSDDNEAKKNSTYCLGYVQSDRSEKRLNEILADPQGEWKSYALIALTQQRLTAALSSSAKNALLASTANTSDSIVSEWAMEKLWRLGSTDGLSLLRQLAEEKGRAGERADRFMKAKTGK